MLRRQPESPPFPYPTLFRSMSRVTPSLSEAAVGTVASACSAMAATRLVFLAQTRLEWLKLEEREPAALPTSHKSTESSSGVRRSEEHTSELQSRQYLVCRLL